MKDQFTFKALPGVLLIFLAFSGAEPPAWGSALEEAERLFKESLQSDDFERNRAALQRIIDLAPDSAYGHFSKGWFWAHEENHRMAALEYQAALKISPGFGEARNNLASAYFRLGKWPESIREYEAVLRDHPDWSDTYLSLGSAYYQSQKVFDAIQAWNKAIRLNPSLFIAHYYLGLAYEKWDWKEEALRHYRLFLAAEKDEEEYKAYIDHADTRRTTLWVEGGRNRS